LGYNNDNKSESEFSRVCLSAL